MQQFKNLKVVISFFLFFISISIFSSISWASSKGGRSRKEEQIIAKLKKALRGDLETQELRDERSFREEEMRGGSFQKSVESMAFSQGERGREGRKGGGVEITSLGGGEIYRLHGTPSLYARGSAGVRFDFSLQENFSLGFSLRYTNLKFKDSSSGKRGYFKGPKRAVAFKYRHFKFGVHGKYYFFQGPFRFFLGVGGGYNRGKLALNEDIGDEYNSYYLGYYYGLEEQNLERSKGHVSGVVFAGGDFFLTSLVGLSFEASLAKGFGNPFSKLSSPSLLSSGTEGLEHTLKDFGQKFDEATLMGFHIGLLFKF